MKLFAKKYTNVQSLVFISILSAITIVLFFGMNYLTYAFILISFIFPFLSLFVGLNVNKYYSFIYFFVTILICVFINLYDLSNLLFYLVPSLLIGLIISILINKNISINIQIIIISLFYFLYTLITIPIINSFYEVDFLKTLSNLIFGSNFELSDYILIPCIFLIEFIKTVLTYLLLFTFNQKYKIIDNYTAEPKYFYGISLILLSIFCIVSIFIESIKWLPLLLTFINIIIFCYSLTKLNYKKVYTYVVLSVFIIITIISYVMLYKYINSPYQFVLFNILNFLCGNFYIFNEIINAH